MNTERLLKIKQVRELVPAAPSTIWLWVKDGKFPKPIKIGSGTFWRESEINSFIQQGANQ